MCHVHNVTTPTDHMTNSQGNVWRHSTWRRTLKLVEPSQTNVERILPNKHAIIIKNPLFSQCNESLDLVNMFKGNAWHPCDRQKALKLMKVRHEDV